MLRLALLFEPGPATIGGNPELTGKKPPGMPKLSPGNWWFEWDDSGVVLLLFSELSGSGVIEPTTEALRP